MEIKPENNTKAHVLIGVLLMAVIPGSLLFLGLSYLAHKIWSRYNG